MTIKFLNLPFPKITNEISKNKGVNFQKFAMNFYEDLCQITHIVSHNVEFDINVLKSELYRYKLQYIIDEIDKKHITCSMNYFMNNKIVVVYYNKKIKYPKLNESYKKITGKNIINEHDAKYDVLHLHEIIKILYDEGKFDVETNDENKETKI